MNFYCDSGGVIFHVDPERIFQGSAGVNKIRFVGQFPSNAQVLVSYKLPNGIWTVPKYMTFVSALEEVQAPNGGIFSVWESLLGATPKVDSSGAPVLVDGVQQYELDYTITQNAGTVDVQFFVYVTAEQSNVQNGTRLATEISSITVEKGVPVVVPEYSETDDYEVLLQQILNALNAYVDAYQDVAQRLTTVEGNIGVLQENTANLRTEVDELTDTVDDLNADLTTAEENIETLQEKSIEQQNQINVLSGTVGNISNDLLPIKKNISDLQDDVSEITTDVQNIREALDLSEITETVEVTDKYNSRQTANGLTVYPGQPTTLLKVEGDTIATINKLDLSKSSIDTNIFTVTENGKKITAIGSGSYLSSQIGVLQDLCPTIHIGDVVYLYCKDGTSTLPYGLTDNNYNVVIPVNTATTITAQMLATTVHLGVIPFTQGFVIEDLQITKVQNAQWTPYFEGLKSAEFAGVDSTGVNLVNITDIEGALSTMHFVDRYVFDPFSFETGDYTLSAYFQSEYDGDVIRLNIFEYDKDGNRGNQIVMIGSCSNKKSRQSGVAHLEKGKIYKIVSTFGSTVSSYAGNVYITNIQFQIGITATEYTPYIAPTKYAFPNTVNPLGQTIDFEQKKIVDYGVELVLKGTEAWGTYKYGGPNDTTSPCAAILPASEADNRNGVTTDSQLGSTTGSFLIGNGTTTFWWIRGFEYLGLDTSWVDKVNPTSAELSAALSNFKAYLAQRYADGNPVIVRYVASSVQSETPFTEAQTEAGDSYIPYTGGTETVENANAEWGLENNITQEYDIVNKIGG